MKHQQGLQTNLKTVDMNLKEQPNSKAIKSTDQTRDQITENTQAQ